MNIIMQDGTETSLKWWGKGKLRVSRTSVILEAERDGELKTLVVARCRSHVKADALFKKINEGIRLQKKTFNVLEWNRLYVPEDQAASE